MPDVEGGRAVGPVVGVSREARAVGAEGVDVAPALVVGEERDALADQHRGIQVAVDLGSQPGELAAALGVPPELARRAAPVALLPGHLPGHDRRHQDRRAAVTLCQISEGAQREAAGRAAVRGDGVGPGVAPRRLPGRADGQHVAVGGPADQPGRVVAPPGEPARAPAVDRGDEDLGRRLPRRRPRHPGAVRGEAGPRHRHVVGREAVGPPSADRGGPHVVLRDEDERVAVQVRMAQVAGGHVETVAIPRIRRARRQLR